jgi:hypothetical protein
VFVLGIRADIVQAEGKQAVFSRPAEYARRENLAEHVRENRQGINPQAH